MLRDMNMTCKELFFGWECLHREGNEAIYRRRTSSVFFYAAVYVLVLALVRNLAASFLLGLCMAFFLSLTFLFVFFLYGGIIAKTKKLMTLRNYTEGTERLIRLAETKGRLIRLALWEMEAAY